MEIVEKAIKKEPGMRKSVSVQYGFVESILSHPHAQELEQMSGVLDAMPQIAERCLGILFLQDAVKHWVVAG